MSGDGEDAGTAATIHSGAHTVVSAASKEPPAAADQNRAARRGIHEADTMAGAAALTARGVKPLSLSVDTVALTTGGSRSEAERADAEADTVDLDGRTVPSDVATQVGRVRVTRTPKGPLDVGLAKYGIENVLGRGGMGVVVKGKDRLLGRSVAIKTLHPGLENDAANRRRFIIEAQVGAQLEHPNIVPVYSMEQGDEALAFTMRLLGGQTLDGFLKECKEQVEAGAVDEEHALPERFEIFLKVCDAVDYAHSRGVIHRDLKPLNVIVGDHHEVYLYDWGIAKVLTEDGEVDRDADQTHRPLGADQLEPKPAAPDHHEDVDTSIETVTQHGEMVGTATYMPPEQARGLPQLHGPASDQFALGMILRELVTLERPRRGPAFQQIRQAAAGIRFEFEVDAEGQRIPPGLVAIVDKATAHEASDRYESVEAFADDVRRYARGSQVSVYPDPWTRRVFKYLSRRPALVLGTIATLILAAALTAILGLVRTVETQRRAVSQSERLSALTSDVVGRSEAIDASFARTRMLVEGLGVAVEDLLEHDEPIDGELRYGVSGRLVGERGPALASPHPVQRYGFDVSWQTPLYLYPAEVPFADVERTIRVMAPLPERFRAVLMRSLDERAVNWPRAKQLSSLDAGEPPLHVTYAAFENGLLLNYPGYVPFPDDYDPRRRPWYREAKGRSGVFFGRPYPDASGSAILVPCDRALHDAEGRFVGVAGADIALDDLARAMRVDHPGWIRSSLVYTDGTEIIDTEQEGLRFGVGLHNEAHMDARPIEPEVREAFTNKVTGFVRVGDQLVVFDRLEAIDWTFVVRLDARQIL
ncbi:MAG: protein kinase [Myxococcota bacterium]